MDKPLSIIEQKTVEFYSDEIIAVRAQDGSVYVPVRPICDLLGVSWSSQQNRITRDEVLSAVAATISVFITNTQGRDQHRTMLCLPLDYISGFLFGLTPSRVREDIKDKIIRYKKECYQVLWGQVAGGTTFTNHFPPGQVLFVPAPRLPAQRGVGRFRGRLLRQHIRAGIERPRCTAAGATLVKLPD